MKLSKRDKEKSKKNQALHMWERLVRVVQWLIEHHVPQTVIKLIMWIGDLVLNG